MLEVGEGSAEDPGDSKGRSDRKDSGLGAEVSREGRGDPKDDGQEVQDEDGLQEPRVAAAGVEPGGADEHDQDSGGDQEPRGVSQPVDGGSAGEVQERWGLPRSRQGDQVLR